MNILRKIKIIAAVILLVAICLPLGKCSRQDNTLPRRDQNSMMQQVSPRSDDHFAYTYAIGELDFSLRGALTFVAFVWPIVFVLLGKRRATPRFPWIFHAIEVLLSAGTIFWLTCLTRNSHWLYGAYVVLVAAAIYGLTALEQLVSGARLSIARVV